MNRRTFLAGAAAALAGGIARAGGPPGPSVVMKFLDSDTPLFPYRAGPKRWWGFIDETGRVVIPSEESRIITRLADFNEGLAAMEFDDRSSAMIDATGTRRFAIYPEYHGWNYILRGGLLPFRDATGKWGYVDSAGKWVVPAQFDIGLPFSDKRAVVRKGGLNGIIDRTGRFVVPLSLKFALGYREGLAAVQRQGERWIYIDPDGRPAFARDFEGAREFGGGMAPVRSNGRWGAIDRRGDLVVPCIYQDAWTPVGSGPMLIKQNDRWGFVNAAGRVAVEPVYPFSYGFSCGRAAVQDETQAYRFIDTSGMPLFGKTYDEAYSFVLDRAPVRNGAERSWIDRDGKTVFRWREAQSFLPPIR